MSFDGPMFNKEVPPQDNTEVRSVFDDPNKLPFGTLFEVFGKVAHSMIAREDAVNCSVNASSMAISARYGKDDYCDAYS